MTSFLLLEDGRVCACGGATCVTQVIAEHHIHILLNDQLPEMKLTAPWWPEAVQVIRSAPPCRRMEGFFSKMSFKEVLKTMMFVQVFLFPISLVLISYSREVMGSCWRHLQFKTSNLNYRMEKS